MPGVKEAIAFVQQDINRLLKEREHAEARKAELVGRVAEAEKRIHELDAVIQTSQRLITSWRKEYEAELAAASEAGDVGLAALREHPYRQALEYLADRDAGLVRVGVAIRQLREAGFPVGNGNAVRAALTEGKKRGDWLKLGGGRWQRVRRTNGNGRQPPLRLADNEVLLPSETVLIYCRKCHTKRESDNLTHMWASNGRPMLKGTCRVCGTKMTVFVKE